MRGTKAQGETLATVDETLGLGRLSPNGADAAQGEWVDVERRLLAALALEAVGIGSKAIELALAYVSDREQFGKKIGSYQAISHSLVDGYVAVELSRSLAYWAAWCVAEDDEQVDLAVAAAKSQATEAAVLACEKSIQAHGGHRLHLGAPAASLLQACALAGRRARLRPRAPRGDRSIPSVLVTGTSTGIGAGDRRRTCGTPAGRSTPRCGAPARRPQGRPSWSSTSPTPRAIATAAAQVESLDALVDNAGIAIAAPLEFLPPEELTRQLDVNVVGQLRVLQAFLPALRRSRGRIVLMGSIGGRSALPFLGAYVMSKFALEAMADALRIELAPFGCRSRSSSPGRSPPRSGRSRSARPRSSRPR